MDKQINATYKKSNIGTNINADTCIVNHINNIVLNKNEPFTSSLPILAETFVGRENEIKELNKLFFIEKQKMVVVSGFSGLGKSEFAKRFVFAHKDQCNILWINVEKIKESFIDIFNITNENPSEIYIKSLCESFKKRTFIIFDNASKREQIRKYEVNSENVQYIITSNKQNWGSHIKVINLEVLTEEAALKIFEEEVNEKFKEEDVETYKEIANLVGYVPLTLKVASGHLYQEISILSKTFVLQNYLARLKKPESDNFAIMEKLPEYNSEDYEKSFYVALTMTLDSIQILNCKDSCLASTVINICAFLFSDRIKFKDISNIPHFKKLLDRKDISENDIRRACHLLKNYCLINMNSDEESFQIHNLIQRTLIYQQNCFSFDTRNIYFYYNLEILLGYDDTALSHRNFILNPCLNLINTFKNFVTEYYIEIKKSPNLCINLIFANNLSYLNEVFNKMGTEFSCNYINTYFLLHMAVKSKHYDMIEFIINCGADVDLKYEYKNETALMSAAFLLDLKTIKLLMNKSCQIKARDKNDNNVLFYVLMGMVGAQNKYKTLKALEILRLLVDKGADVTARGSRNISLLHGAAEILNIDIMLCFIQEYKLNVNVLDIHENTPLFCICHSLETDRKYRIMAAKFLVDSGADVKHKNIFKNTASDEARLRGATYLSKYLNNTDQDFTDVEEDPVADELLRAVTDGDLNMVQHLFEKFEEQVVQLAQSCQAPQLAVLKSHYQILECLLDHGVPVDFRGEMNKTILHTAAYTNYFSFIKILVDRGADLAATDSSGWSVLFHLILGVTSHYDKEDQAIDILKWLIDKGADLKHVDNNKSTLIHIAAIANTSRLLRFLVQDCGLNINAINIEGTTALHIAIVSKNMSQSEDHWWETVRCLLDLGARLDISDNDGRTPIEIAKEKNLSDLVDLLTSVEISREVQNS